MKKIFEKMMALLSVLLMLFAVGCSESSDDGGDDGDDNTSDIATISVAILSTSLQFYDTEDVVVNLSGTSSEGLASMVVSDSSGAALATETSFTNSAYAEKSFNLGLMSAGEYTFTGTATDVEGNEDSVDIDVTVIADGDSDLVFHVSFDGGSATELVSGLTATTGGSATFGADMDDTADSAYQGATDSYFSYDISDATWLDQTFTISFWYKDSADQGESYAGLVTLWGNESDATGGYRGVALLRRKTSFSSNIGTVSGDTWCGASSSAETTSGGSTQLVDVLATGEWQFITFTSDGTTMNMYIDGVLSVTNTLSSEIDWTGVDTISIGSGLPYFSRYTYGSALGQIDDVRIYAEPLSAAGVVELMNEGI